MYQDSVFRVFSKFLLRKKIGEEEIQASTVRAKVLLAAEIQIILENASIIIAVMMWIFFYPMRDLFAITPLVAVMTAGPLAGSVVIQLVIASAFDVATRVLNQYHGSRLPFRTVWKGLMQYRWRISVMRGPGYLSRLGINAGFPLLAADRSPSSVYTMCVMATVSQIYIVARVAGDNGTESIRITDLVDQNSRQYLHLLEAEAVGSSSLQLAPPSTGSRNLAWPLVLQIFRRPQRYRTKITRQMVELPSPTRRGFVHRTGRLRLQDLPLNFTLPHHKAFHNVLTRSVTVVRYPEGIRIPRAKRPQPNRPQSAAGNPKQTVRGLGFPSTKGCKECHVGDASAGCEVRRLTNSAGAADTGGSGALAWSAQVLEALTSANPRTPPAQRTFCVKKEGGSLERTRKQQSDKAVERFMYSIFLIRSLACSRKRPPQTSPFTLALVESLVADLLASGHVVPAVMNNFLITHHRASSKSANRLRSVLSRGPITLSFHPLPPHLSVLVEGLKLGTPLHEKLPPYTVCVLGSPNFAPSFFRRTCIVPVMRLFHMREAFLTGLREIAHQKTLMTPSHAPRPTLNGKSDTYLPPSAAAFFLFFLITFAFLSTLIADLGKESDGKAPGSALREPFERKFTFR
ncbi:hypothetical protein BDK51DRAFT_29148 [Blyttiomyces helicus]|uniref:Uncharacterized protein n=1 Tax=Blyttiomyces helicus TaxID=388810 RepID=A0A4P9WGZ5_9FUNG|nr:hypothetical protein BDK51DRAFT_29148 [Blyttiomyces helicus]|eukprot:RKO90320.1 hypothetical protein BDK51DRAFT_29148 [Blyttiomyces helicus]